MNGKQSELQSNDNNSVQNLSKKEVKDTVPLEASLPALALNQAVEAAVEVSAEAAVETTVEAAVEASVETMVETTNTKQRPANDLFCDGKSQKNTRQIAIEKY